MILMNVVKLILQSILRNQMSCRQLPKLSRRVIDLGAQLQLIRPHSTASLPLFSRNTLSTQTYTNSHLQSEPGEKFLHPSRTPFEPRSPHAAFN